MEGMIKYIFGELHTYKDSVNDICKVLLKQKSFNRNLAFVSIGLTALAVVQHVRINSQEEKIKLLYREIQKIKNPDFEDEG